jgi:hypothetical protein
MNLRRTPSRNAHRSWIEFVLSVIAFGTLLLFSYLGVYACVVVRGSATWDEFAATGTPLVPGYPIDSTLMDRVFAPAHYIDRRIRSEYWTFSLTFDGAFEESLDDAQTSSAIDDARTNLARDGELDTIQ